MPLASDGALCGAGRGLGTRVTDGRLFTGRRTVGRGSFLGVGLAAGLGAAAFLPVDGLAVDDLVPDGLLLDGLAAGFLAEAFFALSEPFLGVIFLAMTLSCCLLTAILSHEVWTIE